MKSESEGQHLKRAPDLMKGLENDDDYPSPAPTYEAISSLQQDLEAERNSRKEERFIWFFVLILVLDVFTFKDMETWSGPLMVGILEIILVVALGRRWSMDHIYTITELIINKWNGKFRPE